MSSVDPATPETTDIEPGLKPNLLSNTTENVESEISNMGSQPDTNSRELYPLREHSITVCDYAFLTPNPIPEHFDPFSALADYEQCMRRGNRRNTPFRSAIWDPLASPDSTIAENLASLPEETPNEIDHWGLSPMTSISFPLLYLNPPGLRDTADIKWLLDVCPYDNAPDSFTPQQRASRYSPVPGKILHRLVEIGWVSDREAWERWLDSDWFALRDYRRHLEKQGGGAFQVVSAPSDRSRYGSGVPDEATRKRVRREAKQSIEAARRKMEMKSLMLALDTKDEEAVKEWYRRNGYGYVVDAEMRIDDDEEFDLRAYYRSIGINLDASSDEEDEIEAPADALFGASSEVNEKAVADVAETFGSPTTRPVTATQQASSPHSSPSCSSPSPRRSMSPSHLTSPARKRDVFPDGTSTPPTPGLSSALISPDSSPYTPLPSTPRTDTADLALVHNSDIVGHDQMEIMGVDEEPVGRKRPREENPAEEELNRSTKRKRMTLPRVPEAIHAQPTPSSGKDMQVSELVTAAPSARKRAREDESQMDGERHPRKRRISQTPAAATRRSARIAMETSLYPGTTELVRNGHAIAAVHASHYSALLESSQSQIADITSQIQQLERTLITLQSNERQYRSLFAPIRKLPTEILSRVFAYTATPSLFRTEVSLCSSWAVSLSSVCLRWRTVALGTCDLWTPLSLHLAPALNYPQSVVTQLERHLERSAKASLQLEIILPQCSMKRSKVTESSNLILQLVLDNVDRCRVLKLDGSRTHIFLSQVFLKCFHSHFSSLEDLEIILGVVGNSQPGSMLDMIQEWPSEKLRRLSIGPSHKFLLDKLETYSFPYTQITHITLDNEFQAVVALLGRLPNLQHVHLTVPASLDNDGDSDDDDEQEEQEEEQEDEQEEEEQEQEEQEEDSFTEVGEEEDGHYRAAYPIRSLPLLKELTVQLRGVTDSFGKRPYLPMYNLLFSIDAPRLTSLTLKSDGTHFAACDKTGALLGKGVEQLIARSNAQLERFGLDCVPFTDTVLLRLIGRQEMCGLRELGVKELHGAKVIYKTQRIGNVNFGSSITAKKPPANLIATNHLLKSLVWDKTDATESRLLPQLRSLRLHVYHGFSAGHLETFLESRRVTLDSLAMCLSVEKEHGLDTVRLHQLQHNGMAIRVWVKLDTDGPVNDVAAMMLRHLQETNAAANHSEELMAGYGVDGNAS
ncbi:hypothetical protein VNI00_014050 [Paramarasmius palmivorus]|uniref:F-box domain-containing protein n=1 Tax=Paramarasmius palmivorus TaxID=297713 RepID=A0AAW0BUD8_9AGAR